MLTQKDRVYFRLFRTAMKNFQAAHDCKGVIEWVEMSEDVADWMNDNVMSIGCPMVASDFHPPLTLIIHSRAGVQAQATVL